MSHFTVLVIGENVEQQLQPYHEFECTGTNDEFVQDVDVTDEMLEAIAKGESIEDALSYYGLENKIVGDVSEVKTGAGTDDDAPHKYGYAIVKDGKLVKAVNRTNPNKKWDWYQVGGRWSGFLKLKAGASGELGSKGLMGSCSNDGPGYADQCSLGDIDLEGMRNDAGSGAGEKWDKAHAALSDAGAPTEWNTWEKCRDELHKGDIEAARAAYHDQPSVKAIKKAFDDFFVSPDQYMVTREQYVQQARDRAISTYAVLKDGRWIAKGEMGWFGMSDDKETQGDWNRKVNDLLGSLPPETLITVVDCHI